MLKYIIPIALCAVCAAQNQPASSAAPATQYLELQKMSARIEAGNEGSAAMQSRFEQQQIAYAVAERHAQLQRDTEKLMALTAELKQHVDKAGRNFLSMEVIKKAQEIQKLAKSVQDKMKNAY
jgi:ribosomal protein L9